MKLFRDNELPSCTTCTHATLYIPYYTFRFNDPYCMKGHGKCEYDKLCGDYRMMTATCGRCEFIEVKDRNTGFVCRLHENVVSFCGRACDDFRVRNDLIRG